MSDINEVRFDPSLLPEKRREAVIARGELLLDISEGRLSAWEAIMSVVLDDRQSLRRLRLDQILVTQEGIGEDRARRVISQILTVLDVPTGSTPVKAVTIGYILDSRAAGRRILATLEAFISYGVIGDAEDLTVWPGFPYAPAPSDRRKDSAP